MSNVYKMSQNKHLVLPAIQELPQRAQINTVGQLLKYSPEQLQEIKNFGRKSANEVFAALKNKLGITLS